MVLIFGGAYQGKLEYAVDNFDIAGHKITNEDVFLCDDNSMKIDFSKVVIRDLEKFVLSCVNNGVEARDFLAPYINDLTDKIVIMTDISQGIVPTDPALREWREMCGRTMLWLSRNADSVVRVFCGLGNKLK